MCNCYLGIFIRGHKKEISHIRDLHFSHLRMSEGMDLFYVRKDYNLVSFSLAQ